MEWGFQPDAINEMIESATRPPSYWSQQNQREIEWLNNDHFTDPPSISATQS
jgi:hypothetical protein